ncbi:hypothetical protein FEE95_18840 [Maribacter algarum]|uniref:Uncharacterized protein n=1 Tax=Maribacter algarum (ex Zhang et al. 2020) TaxID=2578118 RepID=A0A5S3PI96_9FLAO|nr:peptidoglycan DD-metalloendopeptidase family protein [Maribacter algarum]TMM53129.1 hypothetical protein FEE95_18840 [Maribacter algarum]
MEPFLLYLLKSGAVLALFLISYQLFLRKETFFVSNRIFLVFGLVASFVLPFITFTRTIFIEPKPFAESNFSPSEIVFTTTEVTQPFNWFGLLAFIYAIGIVAFGFRLLVQLRALQKIKKNANVTKQDNLTHIKTEKEISPFSFFKYIFYNPQLFKKSDLNIILNHEKVHATQLHSLDILLSEIVLILQWFNPVIWLYRKSIKENLEYLADAYTCIDQKGKKHYQYLLLQKVVGANKVTIANPFFNSLIKKRIVMLNQNQSKKGNFLKLFIVLPCLMGFLLAFNVREEVKFYEPTSLTSGYKTETVEFQSPLNQKDIKQISARFGLGQHKLEKDKFHNGIDLVASTGTKVLASNSGTVKVSSKTPSSGNYIVIEHESGYSTKYMHLKNRNVKSGEKVEMGAIIGHVGNTGKSTGPHLHFEILNSGKAINPESKIPFRTVGNLVKTRADTEKKIEIRIDKDTSDEELKKIKQDLAEKGFDFSYTAVHNENNEIISLSIDVKSKGSKKQQMSGSSTFYNDEEPINPVTLVMDDENTMIFMGDKNAEVIHEDEDHSVWVHNGSTKIKTVNISEENGKKTIRVNGKKVSEEEYNKLKEDEESDGHHIKIKKSENGEDNRIIIIKSTDDNEDDDIEWIEEGGNSFFFLHEDGDGDPIYYIDGKQTTKKEFKALSKDKIEKIEVSKGESAKEKYGKKAKNGVVEITTKNN